MIKILIIEDEIPARKKLKRFLEELNVPCEIMAEVDTVTSGTLFLRDNSPDLIFSDIELLDGNVFEIYAHVTVSCPVIFTTAYDRFWMNAFESNGIDYLMKPFSKERFNKAWSKFLLLRGSQNGQAEMLNTFTQMVNQHFVEKKYKKQFTIHTNREIYFLPTADIVFFEASEGVIFAFDSSGKKHIINFSTLKEVEPFLDPSVFFRLNRSQVINRQFIEKMERVSKNTLAVKMKGHRDLLIASQSTTAQLRDWIDQ